MVFLIEFSVIFFNGVGFTEVTPLMQHRWNCQKIWKKGGNLDGNKELFAVTFGDALGEIPAWPFNNVKLFLDVKWLIATESLKSHL